MDWAAAELRVKVILVQQVEGTVETIGLKLEGGERGGREGGERGGRGRGEGRVEGMEGREGRGGEEEGEWRGKGRAGEKLITNYLRKIRTCAKSCACNSGLATYIFSKVFVKFELLVCRRHTCTLTAHLLKFPLSCKWTPASPTPDPPTPIQHVLPPVLLILQVHIVICSRNTQQTQQGSIVKSIGTCTHTTITY